MTAATVGATRARRWTGNETLRIGGIGAAVALYLCLVGIVGTFNQEPLIAGVISLGQTALLVTWLATGYFAAWRTAIGMRQATINGTIAGALSGAILSALVVVGSIVDLRAVFLQC